MWPNLNYKMVKKIGEGTYSYTYVVNKITTNQLFCLKYYKLSKDRFGYSLDFIRDVIHHSNTYSDVKVQEIGENYVICDLFDGDIDSKNINQDAMDKIRSQLKVLHSAGFIHSDIKETNILFKESNIYSICDFGLTEYYGFPCIKKPYISTMGYKHPNHHQRNSVNLDLFGFNKCFSHLMDENISKKICNTDKVSIFEDEPKIKQNMEIIDIFDSAITKNNNIYTKPMFCLTDSNIYHKYYVNHEEEYELDFLDNMYEHYKYCIYKKNTTVKKLKLSVLKTLDMSVYNLDTIFFAFYLVDNLEKTNDMSDEYFVELCCLFSVKFLEYEHNWIATHNDFRCNIDYEKHILSKFVLKELQFTPIIFFLYFYLYKIAKKFTNDYFTKWSELEETAFSFLILYLVFNPIVKQSYDDIVKTVLKMSYYFLLDISSYEVEHLIEKSRELELDDLNRCVFSDKLRKKIL